MRLERLELSGFKSFPDRADVRFDTGVTAIVGAIGKALETREFEAFEAHWRPECNSRCLLGQ